MNPPINKIECGENLEVMGSWPDNSVSTIITDPPYGLGFMGKDWDTFDPVKINEVMAKDKRKHTQIASQRRSNTAGTYDHRRNAEFQAWFTIWAKECLRIAKPGAFLLCFGGTRTYHRLTCAIEDAGWEIRDCLMWLYGSGFPKSHDISKAIDKAKKQEREVIGNNPNARPNQEGKQPLTMSGKFTYQPLTAPTTDLAKLWDGYGTALKPAWEPIVVAMKPLDGTFAQNAEKWGVAGLDIDGGRISTSDKLNGGMTGGSVACSEGWDRPWRHNDEAVKAKVERAKQAVQKAEQKGRWPANLILDEEAGRLLDQQSGVSKSTAAPRGGTSPNPMSWGKERIDGNKIAGHSDSGGCSRFFYCAKSSKAERNAGCEGLEERSVRDAEGNKDNWDLSEGKVRARMVTKPQSNHHPTVKPLALMEYLCRLTKTPAGGLVLDPFGGSGTTAIACINTGRDFVLIEKDAEYCEIAEKRVEYWRKQKEVRAGQMGFQFEGITD